ncbi:hypothetical protein [Piscirickettsia litoralis]|uniref:Uncharacterized protein n=1 Tax=Piscirickettsia litoralis TaxID=1891921 RepID=A0ABX3A5I0_9GAMM|nr:hypothetical protein [Piscirickettsia litoralis]ODN43462.1 hypothetical protein BGC07_11695 [Piscirickettsia litoralis]
MSKTFTEYYNTLENVAGRYELSRELTVKIEKFVELGKDLEVDLASAKGKKEPLKKAGKDVLDQLMDDIASNRTEALEGFAENYMALLIDVSKREYEFRGGGWPYTTPEDDAEEARQAAASIGRRLEGQSKSKNVSVAKEVYAKVAGEMEECDYESAVSRLEAIAPKRVKPWHENEKIIRDKASSWRYGFRDLSFGKHKPRDQVLSAVALDVYGHRFSDVADSWAEALAKFEGKTKLSTKEFWGGDQSQPMTIEFLMGEKARFLLPFPKDKRARFLLPAAKELIQLRDKIKDEILDILSDFKSIDNIALDDIKGLRAILLDDPRLNLLHKPVNEGYVVECQDGSTKQTSKQLVDIDREFVRVVGALIIGSFAREILDCNAGRPREEAFQEIIDREGLSWMKAYRVLGEKKYYEIYF